MNKYLSLPCEGRLFRTKQNSEVMILYFEPALSHDVVETDPSPLEYDTGEVSDEAERIFADGNFVSTSGNGKTGGDKLPC